MTWPAAFHPNGQTARPLGTPAPITVNADELFVGVHVDDLAGGVPPQRPNGAPVGDPGSNHRERGWAIRWSTYR
jgi:hypothetical protein